MPTLAVSPRTAGLFLAFAVALLPGYGSRFERSTAQDLELVKAAECEYRGIDAYFEALTKAYALKVYQNPELLRWEARLHPHNPEHETLVTAVFRASGVKSEAPPAPPEIRTARDQALPVFGVTWCLNILASRRIAAYDVYAQDALAVYRHTVDEFMAQMVILKEPGALREGPDQGAAVVASVEGGAILLRERQQDGWSYVRFPSSSTAGWLADDCLQALSYDQ